MNPAYASWPFDGRGAPDRAPNIGRWLDRRWLADWRALRSIARVPVDLPPADHAQLAAWAKGEPTTGPRWERAVDVELRQRWEARRREPEPPPRPPLGEVGPWRHRPQAWQRWARHAVKRGREHVHPLVYLRPEYGGKVAAEWCEWRIDGLVKPPRLVGSEAEVKAAVDAWLVGQRVTGG